jgi:hypothetical protein
MRYKRLVCTRLSGLYLYLTRGRMAIAAWIGDNPNVHIHFLERATSLVQGGGSN